MARIILITDHKWRDLPGNTYLKVHLEKNYGHKVLLVRLGEEMLYAPSFAPDMVIYNNLYAPKVNEYARRLKENGIKVVILPTEGITFSEDQTLLFSHKFSGIDFADNYIAWNSLISNALKEHDVIAEEKVVKLGCCRFDFYSEALSAYRNKRDYFLKQYGIKKENKNILITTNFANAEFWPDYSFLAAEYERQRAKGISKFSDPGKLAKYEYDYRESVFQILRDLCNEVSDVNIIIKHHPSERASVYEAFIGELKSLNPNVYLIQGEYIWDLIEICDLNIQRCSTVAIEAWLLDKPTVELELMASFDHFLQPKYKEGSFIVSDAKSLIEIVAKLQTESIYVDAELAQKREAILKDVIQNHAGGATPLIAAHIDSLLQNLPPPRKMQYDTSINRIKYYLRSLLGTRGYTIVMNLWKLKFGDYLGRYDKSFSDQDRKEWEKKLSNTL